MTNAQPSPGFDRMKRVFDFLFTAAKEIFDGIRRDRIPAHLYCYPGILVAAGLIFHLDAHVLPKLPGFHVAHRLRMACIYFLLFSGWIVWGLKQAVQRNRTLDRLMDAFEAAKLKCNGRYPSLISDVESDQHVRRLRLKTNGVTLTEIQDAREKIETMLNFTIVRILPEDGDKSRVDILYTMQDLPPVAHLEHRERFADAQIPIGLSYEGDYAVNLRDIGHILVAGQTGGGKSNYLKLVTSLLAENNPESNVLFLDFKGGMESADLKIQVGNLCHNIAYVDGTAACAEKLCAVGKQLDERLTTLTKNGAATLDDYLKKQLWKAAPHDQAKNTGRHAHKYQREFIVIDEMAQLYAREPGVGPEVVKEARAAVNRIARQGRAAGVHLIAATQKPDSSSFDQTVKANLPGVLCFPMATQAASVSAIGTKRAYEIDPKSKGRAVWKFGPEVKEVQTYLFT